MIVSFDPTGDVGSRRAIMPDMRSKQMNELSNKSIETLLNRAAVNLAEWDQLDPVANAVLDLITTQNAVQSAIDATGEERDDGTFATDAEVDAAFDARTDAIMELLAAQTAYWRRERSRRGKSRRKESI